jgi:ATP-dependent exoDNAse (exonuclease V) alpha subunit
MSGFAHTVKDGTVFRYRCVATHVPSLGGTSPTTAEIAILHEQPISNRDKKNCLTNYLDLAIGSRVRCIKNKGTQIGIFNGAMGTVVGFVFEGARSSITMPLIKEFQHHGEREIPIVLVQMDEMTALDKDIIPFAAEVDEEHPLKANGRVFYRKQLPLELSYSSTIHKYQGLTAKQDVVVYPCRNPFAMGLEYVGVSRTTSLDRLHLISPLEEKHFACAKFIKSFQMIKEEYKRLRLLTIVPDD